MNFFDHQNFDIQKNEKYIKIDRKKRNEKLCLAISVSTIMQHYDICIDDPIMDISQFFK